MRKCTYLAGWSNFFGRVMNFRPFDHSSSPQLQGAVRAQIHLSDIASSDITELTTQFDITNRKIRLVCESFILSFF